MSNENKKYPEYDKPEYKGNTTAVKGRRRIHDNVEAWDLRNIDISLRRIADSLDILIKRAGDE